MANVLLRMIVRYEGSGLFRGSRSIVRVFEKPIQLPDPPKIDMRIKWNYESQFNDGDTDPNTKLPENWVFIFGVQMMIYNITTGTYECIETSAENELSTFNRKCKYLEHVGFTEKKLEKGIWRD